MSPLQGGGKKVNHSLSFVLGSKHLITPKKSQIPNMFQNISFKQTSADAGIKTPTLGNLQNNSYCSPDTCL